MRATDWPIATNRKVPYSPELALMFYGIPDLTTFIIGTIVLVLLPGPNSLYVVALAAGAVPGDQARGRRPGATLG